MIFRVILKHAGYLTVCRSRAGNPPCGGPKLTERRYHWILQRVTLRNCWPVRVRVRVRVIEPNPNFPNISSLSPTPPLRFNGHFPGEPGLAGVYWTKGWCRWWWQLDYRSYKSCKVPVKSSPPTNQHPVFYRPDAFPVAQPTVSKHWRENITFHGLAYPKLTWGLPNFVSDH